MSRAFDDRSIVPWVTKQPATVPTLEILNICRTTARPRWTSLISGTSMPSTAFLISSVTW